MSDLSRGLKSLHDAEDDYEEARDYYDGTVEEFFSNPKIAKALEKAKSRFRLNFAAIPVDKRVDRMRPGAITVPKNDTLSAVLKERFWDANDFDDDLDGWLREAAKFGDYYLLVWPGEEGEDGEGARTVEVFGNSPLVMRAIYSRENARKMLFVIKEWVVNVKTADGGEEERTRVNLYYADRIERWVSKVGVAAPGEDDSNFERFVPEAVDGEDEEDSDIANPYGRIPVFHLRFGGSKPYGTPVHKVCYGAQDAINKITMTHLSTIDFQGFPQRYALMENDASDLDDDGGEVFGDDATDLDEPSQSGATRKKSRLKGGAGEVWWLDGVKAVGQFESAGHEPFLEPAKFYVRAMGTLSNTPLYEFDLEGSTPPSGEARRRADGPINSDVKKAESVVGQAIEDAAAFALLILGHGEQKVELAWLPTDDATDADDVSLIASKTKAGVPLRQALLEAGYATEQIDQWWPENGANVSLGDLLALSQAIASLGQGATLGAITAQDVARIVPPGILAPGERESVTPPKPKAPVPAPPPEPAPVA